MNWPIARHDEVMWDWQTKRKDGIDEGGVARCGEKQGEYALLKNRHQHVVEYR